MASANFRMLIHEFLNEDPDMISKEAPFIFLDSESPFFMANNVKDIKHTRHIARRMHFVRNVEKV